ncbi:hypothetical protein H5410_045071 [Solanum commersonii]|uniref:Uncharacterized protein n=1 Tax=Solanum commersonii TaxID=4109 RepID=A0A9J5XAN7_SOLCO|nr:hypothetical protein H5410_045071 [Solanum commersonii]
MAALSLIHERTTVCSASRCYLHTLAVVPLLTDVAANPKLISTVIPTTASTECFTVFFFILLMSQYPKKQDTTLNRMINPPEIPGQAIEENVDKTRLGFIFRVMLNDWELNRATEFYSTSENIGGLQEGAIDSGGMGIVVVHTRLRIGLGSTSGRQRYHIKWLALFDVIYVVKGQRQHLFLHCKLTEQLWRIFINLRGITWIMPGKISDLTLVDNLEREKFQMFEDLRNFVQKIKLNCILLFCFFDVQFYPGEAVEILNMLDSI